MKTSLLLFLLVISVSAGAEEPFDEMSRALAFRNAPPSRREVERTEVKAVDGKVQIIRIHGKYEEYEIMTKEQAVKLGYDLLRVAEEK